jgi:hypothetical protein
MWEIQERLSWREVTPRRQDDAEYDAEDEQEEEVDLIESGFDEDYADAEERPR